MVFENLQLMTGPISKEYTKNTKNGASGEGSIFARQEGMLPMPLLKIFLVLDGYKDNCL